MILKRYAAVKGRIEGGKLRIDANRFHDAEYGNIEVFLCGTGSKECGFAPHSWVIRHGCSWYIRPVGNGQRGQYRRTRSTWETDVRKPDLLEAAVLRRAKIVVSS